MSSVIFLFLFFPLLDCVLGVVFGELQSGCSSRPFRSQYLRWSKRPIAQSCDFLRGHYIRKFLLWYSFQNRMRYSCLSTRPWLAICAYPLVYMKISRPRHLSHQWEVHLHRPLWRYIELYKQIAMLERPYSTPEITGRFAMVEGYSLVPVSSSSILKLLSAMVYFKESISQLNFWSPAWRGTLYPEIQPWGKVESVIGKLIYRILVIKRIYKFISRSRLDNWTRRLVFGSL